MKALLFVSVFAVGLWTLVAPAQEATSAGRSSPRALKLSVTEQAVWEQEETYWRLLKADNRQGYLDLWDDRFVGWPRFENAPIGKDNITRMMSERKVLDYKLEPLSVREFRGDVVVTLYRATVRSTDTTGSNESTRASRLTHTWMKGERGWRIIGGMSAEDQTSPLSQSSP
jgi:ketosteroid isomerase-like protein